MDKEFLAVVVLIGLIGLGGIILSIVQTIMQCGL